MAEYIWVPAQEVNPNQNILLEDSIPCTKGYVIHRNGSGILTLRGIVNCPTSCFARYQVTFNGNIAVPTGGTLAPIAIAIALDGEALASSRAIVTPAAVGDYFNVTSTAFVTVPRGCCTTLSVENNSSAASGEIPSINVQNANLVVSRVA